MDKMRMETIDMTAQNVEKIGALFPNCITEMLDEEHSTDEHKVYKNAINFDLLRQMLSGEVVEGNETYEFTWVGKKNAIIEANRPIKKTLRPCLEKSVEWDKTSNLYIEGDNLEVLKLLQVSYMGTVDLIYIDPPYNTGKDFIYPDSFLMNETAYNDGVGYFDEFGNVNFKRENNKSAARYHSDWCSMIYPRLMLARNLLKDNGVIFISIDDNEYDNLKKISDEVFGYQNYIITFHIQVRYSNKTLNVKNDWQPVMEYVLVYAKDATKFTPNKPFTGYSLDAFKYKIKELSLGNRITVNGRSVDIFKKGEWTIEEVAPSVDGLKETWVSGSIYSGTGNGTMVQNVIEPRVEDDGYGSLYKIYGLGEDGLGYRYFQGPQKEGANRAKMFSGVPFDKRDAILAGTALKYQSIPNMYDFSPDFGNIRHEGGISFNSGKKPVKMMKQIINYCANKDALILDFFSGSASTAEGVLQLNQEDGGARRFIMVQVPEVTDEKSDAFKAGFNNICELGERRIKNVIDKIKSENSTYVSESDEGFRVFRIDDSNMKDVYYTPDSYNQDLLDMFESNIKEDRNELDLLFGCLLEWGLPLSLPYTSENIEECTVHTYNEGDLIACFNESIPDTVIKEIAKRQPLRAVFRDSSFSGSPEKINVTEVFKLLAPDTQIKVI